VIGDDEPKHYGHDTDTEKALDRETSGKVGVGEWPGEIEFADFHGQTRSF
jgi:hypothetical protein